MQNNDEGLPSIILAGRGLLVKMLITVEPHQIEVRALRGYFGPSRAENWKLLFTNFILSVY